MSDDFKPLSAEQVKQLLAYIAEHPSDEANLGFGFYVADLRRALRTIQQLRTENEFLEEKLGRLAEMYNRVILRGK